MLVRKRKACGTAGSPGPRKKQKESQAVYKLFRTLPAAEGGPVYGELTQGSMDRILLKLEELCDLDQSSVFVDLGAGIGKPIFHAAAKTKARFSIGVECMGVRWWQSIALHTRCFSHFPEVAEKVLFVHADISDLESLGHCTHAYCFSKGFSPDGVAKLAKVFDDSPMLAFVACFHTPAQLDCAGLRHFDLEPVCVLETAMSGSGEKQRCFFYKRNRGTFIEPCSAPFPFALPKRPWQFPVCVQPTETYQALPSVSTDAIALRTWVHEQFIGGNGRLDVK